MKTKIGWIALILGVLLVAGCASQGGQVATTQPVQVENVWARPGITGGNSAVYFTIRNTTGQDETLLSAQAEVAAAVELHMSTMSADGTMSMQPQESVPVPPNGEVNFEPAGLHVMLINLPEALSPGDQFPLTLTFQNAGEIEVQVTVNEP